MKFCLLWLFLSAVLSDSDQEHFVNGVNMNCDDHYFDDEGCIEIFLKDQRGLRTPYDLGGFIVTNITCILSPQLSCTWNALNVPPDAEYNVTIFQESNPTTVCDCDKTDGRVTGCHGNIESQESFRLRINVSSENFWYLHSHMFDPKFIVKLNPPQNVSLLGKSMIRWDPPEKGIPDRCLRYQLRRNKEDEPMNLTGERRNLSLPLTKNYSVQLRVTKSSICRENNIWSDWSIAVGVHIPPEPLNPLVIGAIPFGILMFVLAVLLAFRCKSEMGKLLPVPGPSDKFKQLLENDDFIQVFPAKYIEEITEVLLVEND